VEGHGRNALEKFCFNRTSAQILSSQASWTSGQAISWLSPGKGHFRNSKSSLEKSKLERAAAKAPGPAGLGVAEGHRKVVTG
jgi:hypothetical protein